MPKFSATLPLCYSSIAENTFILSILYTAHALYTFREYIPDLYLGLNLQTGKDGVTQMEKFLPGKYNERAQVYADLARSMNEGWGFRLGLSLPVVAQYIKIMAVEGILGGKIIVTLYFAHWILLEVLVTLAAMCPLTSQTLADCIDSDMVSFNRMHFGHHLPESDLNFPSKDDGGNPRFEYKGMRYCAGDFIACFLHHMVLTVCLCTLVWMEPLIHYQNPIFSAPFLVAFLFGFGASNSQIAVWPSHPVGKFWKCIGRAQFWSYDRQHGFTLGSDLGIAFLVSWALWCIVFYDSAGTSRPSWPWLDILG